MFRICSVCHKFLIVALLSIPVQATEDGTDPILTRVKVQLKWFHQFQFAGFYAAIQQGYFSEAGLDVELIEGGPTTEVTDAVLKGDADFGIGNSSLLIDYNNGLPVIAVAALFQHSPSVILARRDKEIRTINDLEGRTLMGKIHTAELITYLKISGVDINLINIVPHTGTVKSLQNPKLNGIDATTAYVSSEPFTANIHNIPYRIFNPRDLKINFYGDILFTSSSLAMSDPKLVTSMRNALIKGWKYALNNSDELVSLILKKYNPRKSRLALVFEAQAIIPLFASDLVDVGFMSHRRWRDIADIFVQAELLKPEYRLDGFLFETKEPLPKWIYKVILLGLILLAVTGFIAIYILRINRRLKISLEQIKEQNNKIEYQATHDTLTGLPELRLLHERWDKAVARADREASRAAMLFIDLDDFKLVNDTYGHLAGDYILKVVSNKLIKSIRSVDTAARLGGDEFVVILDCIKSSEDAPLIANKLIDAISQPVHFNSHEIQIGVSIGIAVYPDHSLKSGDIIRLADSAMYKAKVTGKNKFKIYG
jgi:diguanylate cyclase (GGDEF)-like protein